MGSTTLVSRFILTFDLSTSTPILVLTCTPKYLKSHKLVPCLSSNIVTVGSISPADKTRSPSLFPCFRPLTFPLFQTVHFWFIIYTCYDLGDRVRKIKRRSTKSSTSRDALQTYGESRVDERNSPVVLSTKTWTHVCIDNPQVSDPSLVVTE